MEVFADLIPGVVLLIGVGLPLLTTVNETGITLMPVPFGAVELVLFAIISFVVGMLVQAFGQKAEHTFDPKGQRAEIKIGGRKIRNPFGRISMRVRIESLNEERSSYFQEEFWQLCQKEFDFPCGTIEGEDAKQLWRFIRARVAASPYSLSIRYHALNNMSRGLWAAFGILFLYYLVVIAVPQLLDIPTDGSGLLIAYAVTSGTFMLAFGQIKNTFKKIWFDNLLFEYYLIKNDQSSG